jgi:hypothetical protein
MILTQSKVKSIEQAKCYRKVQAELSGELQRFTSEEMLKGSFQEFLCLGSGAGYGDPVTDLPRLRNGNKSADQERIEKQAVKFHRMVDPNDELFMGHTIIDKQVKLSANGKEGTIDFVTVDDSGETWIFDLKSTGDLESGYWSTPEEVDYIQMSTYKHLYRETYGVTPSTGYLIMDYSPRMNVMLLKVDISLETELSHLSRFDSVTEMISEFDEEWPKVPNITCCRYCSLSCSLKMNKAGYNYKEISI